MPHLTKQFLKLLDDPLGPEIMSPKAVLYRLIGGPTDTPTNLFEF